MNHQIGIHFIHLFGDEAKLKDALRAISGFRAELTGRNASSAASRNPGDPKGYSVVGHKLGVEHNLDLAGGKRVFEL